MSSFTTDLVVSPLKNGRDWKLYLPFGYDIGKKGSGDRVKVPRGFKTDYASVPFIFWVFIPPWGKYGKAAVIHDYLYQTHSERNQNMWQKMFSKERKRADNIFHEAMGILGVAPWRKFLMYWAVRLFGWTAWRNKD